MRSLKRNQRIIGSIHCQLKHHLNFKVNLLTLAIAKAFQSHEAEITIVCFRVVNDEIHTFVSQSS